MDEILIGLKGHDWESGLLITRFRGRGLPRVVDDPSNLNLIFANRNDLPKDVKAIREFLLAEYNMSSSVRNVKAALKLQRDETVYRIIKRIKAQYEASPFADSVMILELLKGELSWIDIPDRLKVVALALERLGYVRKRWENGALWTKQST